MGNAQVMINGDFFLSMPGLCGDFRDTMGSGSFSAAINADVSIRAQMMGARMELAVARAQMLLTLGGANKREACTKYGYGSSANPSGLFFKGQLKTRDPFRGNIIGSFFPTMEADVDVFLLANEATTFIPPSVKKQWEEGLVGVIKAIGVLKAALADAMQAKSYPKIIAAGKAIEALYSCAKSGGGVFCWASSPIYAKPVTFLNDVVALIQQTPKDKIASLQAKLGDINTKMVAATTLLGKNIAAAGTRLAAQLTDLADGFGMRAKVGVQFGSPLFAYAGIQVDFSYSRASALKQCDKFKFIL